MTLDQLKKYCLSKPSATFDFPFDMEVMVFRVEGKIFGLTNIKESPTRVNLKCDPGFAEMLRKNHPEIVPGYHMNKMHWNTITVEGGKLDSKLIKSLVDHSYELIFKKLPKKVRESIDYQCED